MGSASKICHARRNSIQRTLRVLYRSLLLVWKAAPKELGRLAGLSLFSGAGSVVLLFLGKVVIGETARLVGNGEQSGLLSSTPLFWSVLGFVALNVLYDSVGQVEIVEHDSLRQRVEGNVKALLYEKVANFQDLSLFESTERLNVLQLAEQGVPRLQRLATNAGNLMTGTYVFVPALLLSFSISWWVPVIVFLSAAPTIWVQIRYERMSWDVEKMQAPLARRMGLHERVLTGPEYAREMRLFGLQPYILGRWRSLFWSAFDEMQRGRRRGMIVVVAWSLLSGLGSGLPHTSTWCRWR